MKICNWCDSEIKEVNYPAVEDFILCWEHGTVSDLFGPNLSGYEVDLCFDCAEKLEGVLIEVGIKVQKINC